MTWRSSTATSPDAPIVPGVAQVDWVMALAPQRLPIPRRASASRGWTRSSSRP